MVAEVVPLVSAGLDRSALLCTWHSILLLRQLPRATVLVDPNSLQVLAEDISPPISWSPGWAGLLQLWHAVVRHPGNMPHPF